MSKQSSIALVSLCFFGMLGCESKTEDKQASLVPETAAQALADAKQLAHTAQLDLKVTGMTCTGCEQSIQDGLKTVAGVVDAKADHKTGQVVVKIQGDSAALRGQVLAQLAQIGYTAQP